MIFKNLTVHLWVMPVFLFLKKVICIDVSILFSWSNDFNNVCLIVYSLLNFIKTNLTIFLFFYVAKSMAHAAEEAAITAAQEAKHAAATAQELMLQAKRAAEKASRAMKIAEEYGGKKV